MYRWKFYSATAEVKHKSDCGENKPVLVGGIGEINFGKQFRQGNRVYSSENVAMACLAQPVGNAGGFSYLYAVNDTNKIKVVGNYMPSNHDASRIVDTNGIAPTVKENHGTVTAVLVDDTYKNREPRLYDKYSPSIRAERQGFKVITNE